MIELMMATPSKPPSNSASYALFAKGLNRSSSGTYTNTTYKYGWDNDAVKSGTVLKGIGDAYGAGIGDTTRGIFAGTIMGNGVKSDIYNYGTDGTTTGTGLSVTRYQVAGMSNATNGYFIGGQGSSAYAGIDKYAFTNDAISSGGTLGVARAQIAAMGNATLGVMMGGYAAGNQYNNGDILTYASNAVSTGKTLSLARGGACAIGETTFALIAGGYNAAAKANTDVYTYAANTCAASTALSTPRNIAVGASTTDKGLISCDGTYLTTIKYAFAARTYSAGTSMPAMLEGLGATSSTPGNY